MIALDTSAVVAAFAPWHDLHAQAFNQLDRDPRLPAHVAVEAYSVLTRLPPEFRAGHDLVAEYVLTQFPEPYLVLDSGQTRTLLAELRALGIAGGATYDAVVAATARAAGVPLLSCDVRAVATYEALGTNYELLA